MSKRIFIVLLSLISLLSFGNDVSNFINLGFSQNSKYFMFAEYGQVSEDNSIFAKSYIVDVEKNDFVKNGVNSVSYKFLPNAESDSLGVVFALFQEKGNLFSKYEIQNYNCGRVIYSMYDNAIAQPILNYRDFVSNKNYDIELNQITFGEKQNLESSFFIDIKITDSNNVVQSKMAGNPDTKRKNVEQYFIRQVIVSPTNDSFVFVVGKKINVNNKVSIRYMVETIKF